MKGVRIVLSGWLVLLAVWSYGEQFAFVGARAGGMAGANAASTRDSTAIWHNPAAFGFMGQEQWASNAVDNGNLAMENFNWETIGIGAGYTLTEDLGRYLDILANIDLDAFEQGMLSGDGQNVQDLLSVAGIVSGLNSGDSLYADATVGTSFQFGHFGIGLRMFGEGAAYALPDLDNLALSSFIDGAAIASDISDASATDADFTSAGYAFTVLTPSQQAELASTLSVTASDDSIKYIDFSLQKLADAGDLEGSEISAAIDIFNEFLPAAGGSIDSNQTVVVGRGFLVTEIPVSYGWALNENLSFGATAKLMHGSVLGTQVWIFNEDNDSVLDDLSDNVKSSLNVGLDLGVMYRIPKFQFALVGHNLNRPTFDGFTEEVTVNGIDGQVKIPDVKIDPQFTAGAAFMPSRRLTLEANLDLLETGSLLGNYDIQRVSFGGEIDLWMVMLRLGAYRNLAVSWQDWVATASIGANILGVRADLGGAISLDNNVEYDGNDIPSEARLYASVGFDF